MGLGLVCQGEFCCGGDGGPSPQGEGRGIISVGNGVRLAMGFANCFKSVYVIIIGKRCPVCCPNLYPLAWTRRHCAGKYGTQRYGAGRHANGGESHGNQQQSTHKCFHLLIVTIANKIGFDCLVLILQKSPFLIGDLHNFHIFWWLNFALIDL